MDNTFVFTTDKETADKLKAEGLICIEDNPNAWKFVNNLKIDFSDNKKITYTNKLFI